MVVEGSGGVGGMGGEAMPLMEGASTGEAGEKSEVPMIRPGVKKFLGRVQWTQLVLCYLFALYAVLYFVILRRFKVTYPDDPMAQISSVVHIVPSAIWFFISPLQFLNPFRHRFPNAHRWMGRIALISTFLGTIAAFLVGFSSKPEGRKFTPVVIAIFGPLYLFYLFNGFRHIKNGDVRRHAKFMSRAQALAVSIIFIRPVTAIIAIWKQWDPATDPEHFGTALGLAMSICFPLSVVIFEIIYARLHPKKDPEFL